MREFAALFCDCICIDGAALFAKLAKGAQVNAKRHQENQSVRAKSEDDANSERFHSAAEGQLPHPSLSLGSVRHPRMRNPRPAKAKGWPPVGMKKK